MPLSHLMILLAIVIGTAAATVWVALIFAGPASAPGWGVLAAGVGVALIARLFLTRSS